MKSQPYEEFVDKFKPKKTTDDCYTPPEIYDAVLAWVRAEYDVGDDVPIVRPFWPGADYERAQYPDGCVVVDNPPFSILAKIIRFNQAHGVRFFLFAPRAGIVVREGRESAYHVVLPGGHELEREAMRSIDETDRLAEQLGAALCDLLEAAGQQHSAEQIRDKVLPFDEGGALDIAANEMDIYDIDPTPVMQLARIYDDALGYDHTILEILERVQARHHPNGDADQTA